VSSEPPPADLVPGEAPLWKKGDVKGFLVHQLVTGYLVTSYRCFIWDVRSNTVSVSVPVRLADVTVEGSRQGKRTLKGGSFIVPRIPDYVPPPMGEHVEVGDLVFRADGEVVMVFRDVAEPAKVKGLIDAVKQRVKVPAGLGVDFVWKSQSRVQGGEGGC
jgi:hypothetical protein